MPFLQNGNDRIHYKLDLATDKKKPETLILLHNNLSDITVFDPIIPYYIKEYTLLRYDLRGFGESDRGNRDLTYDLYVEDLLCIIEHLGISRFHLAGFGFSAIIAAMFASYHSDLVINLILVSLPCNPPQTFDRIREQRNTISQSGHVIPINYILQMGSSLPINHPMIEKWRFSNKNLDPLTYYQVMDLSICADPIQYLKRIDLPVLILSGDKDLLFPQHYLITSLKQMTHCVHITIPGAASYIILDKTEITAMLIFDFITNFNQIVREPDDQITSIYEEIREFADNLRENQASPPMIRIDILDSFRVFVNNIEITEGWNKRFAKSILIYLLFHHSATREQLCDALWPEVSLPLSKKNLRVYLSYLKKLLHPLESDQSLLTTDREYIHLTGNISSDVLQLKHRLYNILDIKDPDKKLALCQDMLNHFPLSFIPALYDDWFLALIDQLLVKVYDHIIWMTDQLMKDGRKHQAVNHLKHCMALFNDDEELQDKLFEILQST